MLTASQCKIADKLWDVGAVKIDTEVGFRLKAHDTNPDLPLSPIYLNLRTEEHPVPEKRGPVTSEIMDLIGDEFFDAISLDDVGWEVDWFVDIPEAGTPFGDQIRRVVGMYVMTTMGRLQLHKTTFDDGTRQIDRTVSVAYGDPPEEGDGVLLVDDLITKAGTKLEAIRALESHGLRVRIVLVLVDRGTGAEDLRKLGYNVIAIMSLTDMIEHYKLVGSISMAEYHVVRKYLGY